MSLVRISLKNKVTVIYLWTRKSLCKLFCKKVRSPLNKLRYRETTSNFNCNRKTLGNITRMLSRLLWHVHKKIYQVRCYEMTIKIIQKANIKIMIKSPYKLIWMKFGVNPYLVTNKMRYPKTTSHFLFQKSPSFTIKKV